MSDRRARIALWHEIFSFKPQMELGHVTAGLKAEVSFRDMAVDSFSFKEAIIFHSKRVPRQLSSGRKSRYEMDFVVLTRKQIAVVEIKDWSGRLRLEGSSWIQERRGGIELTHENAVEKNKAKLDALIEFLISKGIDVPKARFSQVIFWNPNLTVPLAFAERPDVIMRHQVQKLLNNQKGMSWAERLMAAILQRACDDENSRLITDGLFSAVPLADFRKAVKEISALEGYDKVELYGGRILSGDLLDMKLRGDRTNLKLFPSGAVLGIACSRDKFLSLLAAVFLRKSMFHLTYDGEMIAANPSDLVHFHPAGQKNRIKIPLGSIAKMRRG